MKAFYISITSALLFSPGPQDVQTGELGFHHGVDEIPDFEESAQRETSVDTYELVQSSMTNEQRLFDHSQVVKAMQGEHSRKGNEFLKLLLRPGSSKHIPTEKRQCHLPTALAMRSLPGVSPTVLKTLSDQPEETSLSVGHILQSLASKTRVTSTPFLWLHWGESDFMCLANRRTAHNVEHTDYHSRCVYDGLKKAILGDDGTKDAAVIQALGAFFLCKETHRELYSGMQNFILTNSELGHAPKYQFYDSFYLPVGNESSPATSSWVMAAKSGNRPIVLVGPDHLASLHCMLSYVKHFRIPLPTEGCEDVEPLVNGIVELSQSQYSDQSVLFVVAGAAVGKIIAHEAFKKLQHKDVFVDVGSSLDAYAGVRSRDYNRDLGKYCRESKGWMAYDVCEKECQGVHLDRPCQKCES